jgi:hypothetical protein
VRDIQICAQRERAGGIKFWQSLREAAGGIQFGQGVPCVVRGPCLSAVDGERVRLAELVRTASCVTGPIRLRLIEGT